MSSINKVHDRRGNMTPIEFDNVLLKHKAKRLHEFMKEIADGPVEAIGILSLLLDGYKESLGITDVVISASRPQ